MHFKFFPRRLAGKPFLQTLQTFPDVLRFAFVKPLAQPFGENVALVSQTEIKIFKTNAFFVLTKQKYCRDVSYWGMILIFNHNSQRGSECAVLCKGYVTHCRKMKNSNFKCTFAASFCFVLSLSFFQTLAKIDR